MEGCETRHVAQKEPHFLLKMGQKNKEEYRQGDPRWNIQRGNWKVLPNNPSAETEALKIENSGTLNKMT